MLLNRNCAKLANFENFKACLRGPFFRGHSVYIFWGLLPPKEILPGAKFTLCPCLASPMLTVLLHSTGAVCASQTLRRGTGNGIKELLLVIFNRGCHLYSEGGHHMTAIEHHYVYNVPF